MHHLFSMCLEYHYSLSLFTGLVILKPRKCHNLQGEFKHSFLEWTRSGEKDPRVCGELTPAWPSVIFACFM